MSIATGTRLGQYEVQDFLGQGAMGVVYRAYHSQLERTGAVKVMQAITPDPDTVARFRHEAQAIARLRHPNIVGVYDFGEFQGTPYMIVEYIPGGSLAARMSQGAVDRSAALRYLRGIAAGLDYAHSRGVVHRDVKPANVLLTADDSPVLADFGLAKLMQGSSLKSMTGVTTGTPAYMAPEQVTGSRVGPASDRYSLATIAYEILTGVIPFDGEGLMEVLYAQVHRHPPPPSARDASLGPAVDAVIMRGLAKDPAARWESAGAFVEALAAALAPVPVAAEATRVMAPAVASTARFSAPGAADAERDEEPAAAASILTLAYPSPPPPAAAARRRSLNPLAALIAAGVIAALLVAGVVGWAATHRPVAFSLSATNVTAGDSVVVTADRIPPNQAGRVELWSAELTYPFRAGPNGHVEVTIVVPVSIEPGDHLVKICWNGSCHGEQTLHVTALVTTSPTPSPRPSPSALTTPTPVPSPSTSPNPRTLSLSSATIRVGTGSLMVEGSHFAAGKVVSVAFVQQATGTNGDLGSIVVGSTGKFFLNFHIPVTARAGVAYLVACDPIACGYAGVNVISGT